MGIPWHFLGFYLLLLIIFFHKITNIIMTSEKINCLHNTKEDWWLLLRRTFCQLMEQLRPKTGNPLSSFLFLSILLRSFIPNVLNKTYHGTGENKLSEEPIVGLASIKLCHLMKELRNKMGNTLAIFVIYIVLIWCISNVSKKCYHGTGEYQFYAQHKGGLVSVAWDKIVSDHWSATVFNG